MTSISTILVIEVFITYKLQISVYTGDYQINKDIIHSCNDYFVKVDIPKNATLQENEITDSFFKQGNNCVKHEIEKIKLKYKNNQSIYCEITDSYFKVKHLMKI